MQPVLSYLRDKDRPYMYFNSFFEYSYQQRVQCITYFRRSKLKLGYKNGYTTIF
jgi:hypothetical protein